MEHAGNIVIGGRTAEFFYLHDDAAKRFEQGAAQFNPLRHCASCSSDLTDFNLRNPLYGEQPLTLLVPARGLHRENENIECHLASGDYPACSFYKLREGLFMATPELLFLQTAGSAPLARVVELGLNLCGRYWIRYFDDKICTRTGFLSKPVTLAKYVEAAAGQRGAHKARVALQYIEANSGSPEESRSWVQYHLPVAHGGFGLGFTHMNYDVMAGRLASLTSQNKYCLDLVDINTHTCFEYDGSNSHLDPSKDKRRRNELKVLGWDVFPIDSSVLYNPEATVLFGKQLAKYMGKRLRLTNHWEQKYETLRKAIGLPV